MCKGDFDADGFVDIAILTVSIADHLFVFFGSGGSTSLLLPTPHSQLGNNRLGTYDLDGQPGDDILVFEQISSMANAYGIVNGHIVHQQQLSSSMPQNGTLWLWTGGDIDNDADTDIVVFKPGPQPYGSAQYQVLRRSGAATFTVEPQAAGGPAEYLRDIDGDGDFDGDGILDIAMHHQITEYVLLGTGQSGSSFVQAWSHTSVTPRFEPSATLVTDVNGDGLVDILRPNADAKLHLFVNQTTQVGTPAFAHHVLSSSLLNLSYQHPTTTDRPSVSVADFDGDGALDIGFNRVLDQPNTYALLRRLSSDPNVHTYEEINFAIRDGYAVDADGDSDIDLIGERTVRNRRFERDAAGHRLQKHSGIAGENGATPVLGGTGPYRVGGAHTLHLTGVPGPTVAIIGLSIAEANLVDNPLPGLTLYLDPSWLMVGSWPITQNGNGRAAAMSTLALPIFPGTQGWTFYLQAFVPDAAAPSLYTHSNLLALRIGS